MNRRLLNHLEEQNILPDTQHGFRSRKGTVDALTIIHKTLVHHAVNKHQCYMILRDVSMAFDKIWHTGLQYKIIRASLPGVTTRFLNNLIQNRKAKIRINNYIGPPFALSTGAP